MALCTAPLQVRPSSVLNAECRGTEKFLPSPPLHGAASCVSHHKYRGHPFATEPESLLPSVNSVIRRSLYTKLAATPTPRFKLSLSSPQGIDSESLLVRRSMYKKLATTPTPDCKLCVPCLDCTKPVKFAVSPSPDCKVSVLSSVFHGSLS